MSDCRQRTRVMSTAQPRVLDSPFLKEASRRRHAVILLNWTLPDSTFETWETATLRICADGGANRLYDKEQAGISPAVPHAIIGDLDSIRPEVADYYRDRGAQIIDLSHDQDSTDLQKCVAYAAERLGSKRADYILAFGALGGRLDHILSNLGCLYRFRQLRLLLLGDGNLTCLVPTGKSILRPERSLEGPACGLVPLAGSAIASSTGLRWNLDKTKMEMGSLISTSNVLEADTVEVETDTDLVWTIECRQ